MNFNGVCINRKDKNGTLIYEGDFLRCCNGKVYQVVWRDDVLAFGLESEDEPWEFFDEYISDYWEVV
jgi:hypothetical protein